MKRHKKIMAFFLLAFVVFSFYALRLDLSIVRYEVASEKISGKVRIVFLSDLHSSQYGEGQKELLDDIEQMKPDVILLGGDIADDIRPHAYTEIVLKAIGSKYPCYYVTGNHEFWSNDIDAIKKMFVEYGIVLLEGEQKELEVNGQKIHICGVDDPEIGVSIFWEQIEQIGRVTDSSVYTIFMSHRPEYIKDYLDYDFDLIVSGHANGGQWRIPFLLNGVFAPNQGFFPPYAGGRYDFENQVFIVGRGLAKGTTAFVPRICNPPELVVIDLKDIRKSSPSS